MGEEGGDIVRVTKPKRVTVPTFEIVSNPMIPITQIKERVSISSPVHSTWRRLKLVRKKTVCFLTLSMLSRSAAATHAANDPVYNPDIAINAPIDINSMADGFGQVQRHDLSVAFCFFNPRDYTDLLKWTQQNIDRETQRKLLKTGVMGYLWGATLLQSRKGRLRLIYILADAEFLGVIPERIPLTVMSVQTALTFVRSGSRFSRILASWSSTHRSPAPHGQRPLRCNRQHGEN